MAITKPRKEQRCRVCKNSIKNFGVIVYLGHDNYKCYVWMHMECVGKLNEGVFEKIIRNLSSNKITKVTSNSVACSYCEKVNPNLEMFTAGWFYIHPNCIARADAKIEKLMNKHGAELVAGSI